MNLSFLLALVAMLFWAVSDTTIKPLTNKYRALEVAVFKFVPHAVFLFILYLFNPMIPTDLVTWLLIGGFAVVGSLSLYTFVVSIEKGAVSLSVAVAHTNALVTAALSAIFLGEILEGLQYWAILSIIAGVILIVLNFQTFKMNKMKGLGSAIVTALGWGVIYVFVKLITERLNPISTVFLTDFSMVCILVAIYLIKYKPRLPHKNDYRLILFSSLSSVIAAVSVTTSVALGLVTVSLAVVSASPLVTLLLAYVFLKERIKWTQTVGIFVITAGLVVLSLIS